MNFRCIFLTFLCLLCSYSHGDAALCYTIPETDETPLCNGVSQDDLNDLIAVQVLFRHGARTPAYPPFPTDPHKNYTFDGLQLGEITEQGKHWSYRLGQYLRCRYGTFLEKQYSSREVYCQSSAIDRTVITASALLAGLYPQSEGDPWQYIPVFTISSKINNVMSPTIAACPKQVEMIEKDIGEFWTNLSASQLQLIQNLGGLTGATIQSYVDIFKILDTIRVEHCQYNLALPDWFPSMAEEVQELGEQTYWRLPETTEMQRFFSGVHFSQLQTFFDMMLPGSNVTHAELRRVKMNMYSLHDINMAAILQSLGLYDRSDPPVYNAVLLLELYNRNGEYIVKLAYRNKLDGEAEEMRIPGCDPCTLEKFKEVISPVQISDDDWYKECAVNTDNDNSISTSGSTRSVSPLSIALVLLPLLLLTSFGLYINKGYIRLY